MYYKTDPLFPEKFMWGASSAAWQVEGAVSEDGRSPAIIDLNSRTKKPFADNSIAADHYHHYKEDVALMAECGFSSYRFSISWSRIIPASDGKVNQKGIRFYNNLINELIAHNITPIVTLYHYDMPVWVDEQLGGWHDRRTIDAFDAYVRVCFKEFGDRVKYWLSINEQNMQICYGNWLGVDKGCDDWEKDKWRINHIINLCHAKAVIACHEIVKGGKIGPVSGYVPIYPASCKPKDQIAAMNAEELTEKIWNDLYAYGEYNGFVQKLWKDQDVDPDIRPGDMELIKKAKIDYFALNCYRSNVAADCKPGDTQVDLQLNKNGVKGQFVYPKFPGMYQLVANPYVKTTDWDWEIDPIAMRYMLRYVWDHYRLPMMITENGFAAHESVTADGHVHDQARIDFLRDQIFQIGQAVMDGCDVIAYNLWSFTDLLSTGNGMAKRYGLVYINTTDDDVLDLKRIKKDSFNWYSKLIRSNGRVWE
ncbi:MAG TPA: glycoside hydrolase family 1 protein [Ruminococcaceae bacterium]|nr:glycoside hydrolase family 1 protein [Oscillospiraceae bacterium]